MDHFPILRDLVSTREFSCLPPSQTATNLDDCHAQGLVIFVLIFEPLLRTSPRGRGPADHTSTSVPPPGALVRGSLYEQRVLPAIRTGIPWLAGTRTQVLKQ